MTDELPLKPTYLDEIVSRRKEDRQMFRHAAQNSNPAHLRAPEFWAT